MLASRGLDDLPLDAFDGTHQRQAQLTYHNNHHNNKLGGTGTGLAGGAPGGGAQGSAQGHGLGSGAQRDNATGQGLGALSSPNSLHAHAHKATVWVVRYVDYTSKYGLGFLLNTGSAGVYFNDSTKVQGYKG